MITHIGIPFIDIIVDTENSFIGTVSSSVISNKIGGIGNLTEFFKYFEDTSFKFVIDKHDLSFFLSIDENLNKEFFLFKDNIEYNKAVIIHSKDSSSRQSFVHHRERNNNNFYKDIIEINTNVVSLSYIEDFPYKIKVPSSSLLVSDFNNSNINLNIKSNCYENVKSNLLRSNYILFSDDEIEALKLFINKFNDLDLTDKIFVGHSPEFTCVYNFNKQFKLKCKFDNLYFRKHFNKTGNGDLFLAFFSKFIVNKPLEESINLCNSNIVKLYPQQIFK